VYAGIWGGLVMCGISGYWSRESPPSSEIIFELLKYGERRGSDAFGYCIASPTDSNLVTDYQFKEEKLTHLPDNNVMSKEIANRLNKNSVLIMNHRAVPETEVESKNYKSIQPITNQMFGLSLVHNGAVSNFIYRELEKEKLNYGKITLIDSEAIIWAYLKNNRSMTKTMEYLSGGFAFALIDTVKFKLYFVCTHSPLFCGYARGYGLWFNSLEEGVYSVLSKIKGNSIERNNLCVWEDYYVRELPEYTITEVDLNSGMINETKFEPRYVHPNYDPYLIKERKGRKILVSSSGGLDSSTTLAILKMAGYDVTAVHFKYGHRGQDAEEIAIEKVTEILDISLVKFDLEKSMNQLDISGMLTNKDAEILTGTESGLKTTLAWTCFRNGFFMSYMGALAEKLIIEKNYDEVYLTGGFMNLTESGTYCDNSERFINSFIQFAKFASICGTRIKPIYGCANLLKTEQYIMLKELGLLEVLSPWLISCDRPIVDAYGIPRNCSKGGSPACGSGLLSYWASKIAGVEDLRNYYEINEEYIPYVPPSDLSIKDISVTDIVDKLQIHEENKKILLNQLR
jgi:7-cyano-7-deazaguanine synthase in queuosine biosynthesis